MNIMGGGETGAVFVKDNNIPPEIYQTDWTTDNAIRYIDSLDEQEDWFVWVSYGDPHHAYDSPKTTFIGRILLPTKLLECQMNNAWSGCNKSRGTGARDIRANNLFPLKPWRDIPINKC